MSTTPISEEAREAARREINPAPLPLNLNPLGHFVQLAINQAARTLEREIVRLKAHIRLLEKYPTNIGDGLPEIIDYCQIEKETAELTAENTRLKELVRTAICPSCDGSGAIAVQKSSRQYVTKEMANDAGDPQLEGSLYSDDEWEQEECQWCHEKKLYGQ